MSLFFCLTANESAGLPVAEPSELSQKTFQLLKLKEQVDDQRALYQSVIKPSPHQTKITREQLETLERLVFH